MNFLLTIALIWIIYLVMGARKQRNNRNDSKSAAGATSAVSEGSTKSKHFKTRGNSGKNHNQQPDSNEEEFPILKQMGLYASDIKGDGNCLFRALSDQLYGDGGKRHFEIRTAVVKYMMDHSEYFQMFQGSDFGESWDSYINRMASDGVYGDNLEIVAFARHFQVNVVIYQSDFKYVVSCEQKTVGSKPAGTVHIAYHTWEHYSSIRNLDGPHSGPPNVSPKAVPLSGTEDPKKAHARPVGAKWQIDIVKKSLSAVDSPELEALIVRVLEKNNGDIGATVETILMKEVEDSLGDGSANSHTENENMDVEPSPHTEKESIDIGPSSLQFHPAQPITINTPPPVPPKDEKFLPKNRSARLTSRERKERQKRQAMERKRNTSVQLPQVALKPIPEVDGIKTMYI